MRHASPASLVCACALFAARPAAAEAPPSRAPTEAELLARYEKLSAEPGVDGRVLGGLAFGGGLRFNNPYRLRSQLAASAESVSATAPYVDLGFGFAFGPADGVQHGAALRLSVALSGIAQQAFGASYLILYREGALMGYGRAGVSVLAAPDANAGPELAGGFAYFVTGAIGFSAEIVGDLFYGAGTYDVGRAVYPILSGQAGLIVDFEVLP